MNANTAIRLYDIIKGMPQFEDMASDLETKSASKTTAASSGLKKALKYVGGAGIAGAGAAGAHAYGKSTGEVSGMRKGRKMQHAQDVQQFKGQAKNIFRAGRMTQRRQDIGQFKSFLKKNNPGMSRSHHVKQAQEMHPLELASCVVDQWANGDIATGTIATLDRDSMSKVATVLLHRKDSGDAVASILWDALAQL